MTQLKIQPYLLKGKIQYYAWGTKNEQAFIPQLTNIPAKKDLPYAELWMGAHPKAPADIVINNTDIALDRLIEKYPEEILGNQVYTKFNGLPFLFKVLSAAQALSIQAHPTKKQAAILHVRDPQHYPDNNHKPEIAIALSDLSALAGFKTFKQLIQTLQDYPEISAFIGEGILTEMKNTANQTSEEQKFLLKKMFSTFMRKALSQSNDLLKAIEMLDQRLQQKDEHNAAEEQFIDLRKTYPGPDSGLFSLFMLRMIKLKAGQGIFLKPGLAHAYLKGTIIECMANSDNVIRAGLTPKFQDVETLIDILDYDTSPIEIQTGRYNDAELVYSTPAPEFRISRIDMHNEKIEGKTGSVQIFLVIEGEIILSWNDAKMHVSKGQSFLIPAALNSYTLFSNKETTVFKVTVP